jgi:hypothetical protein
LQLPPLFDEETPAQSKPQRMNTTDLKNPRLSSQSVPIPAQVDKAAHDQGGRFTLATSQGDQLTHHVSTGEKNKIPCPPLLRASEIE